MSKHHPKRFLSKTYRRGTCWEWVGSCRKDGYGRYRLDGRTVLAHRASYYYETGIMPMPSTKVCHSCDNPWCVNPEHLFIGTQGDNVRDMFAKGRSNHARQFGETNPMSKLTADQVALIRETIETPKSLASRFGVSVSTIYAVKNGIIWNSENANRRAEMKI